MVAPQTVSTIVSIVLVLTCGALAAVGPVTDLHIMNGDVEPDGYTRSAVLADGIFPGPLIRGYKGDNFRINVIDHLINKTMLTSTTIHWHGIFQRGTNWADGPAFVTQCPITTGNSFLYDFKVPDQAGTFWYHSHLALQYCDGLRGPLVIYDPEDPHADLYDVDDESTVITLADWYHVAAPLGPLVQTPDATLINGRGRSTTFNNTAPLAVIHVVPGLRYRFRLVSISCDPNFVFTIDDHNMSIIEADGVNTDPLPVDSIQIFAAQRYSFILKADQPVNNYWIRADPNNNENFGMAILRYVGAPPTEPTTTQIAKRNPLIETNLHPLTDPAAPGEPTENGADVIHNFQLSFNGTNFFINNKTFVPPKVPVLLQILNGARTAQQLLPEGSVYTLPRNKTVQITLPGGVAGGPHPFHLHGHTFSVVRSAGNSTSNYVNPVRRDTVSIGQAGDDVTIRWRVRERSF
ncbi:laccase [Taiwanofungus camphoratus]|nr:laccase [Antrodia cinnamomea]KAI0924442.1 laccase [Antrodia cinnamomea]KAI0940710.1 laccase [Antrodia cinnamomea]KAI0954779.1 laccase [Antrodia cinnamomea]